MSQTALAKQPKRVKPVILDCPQCKHQITIKPALTLKQQQAITALASGSYPTQAAAAEAAGMTERHLTRLSGDVEFTVALVQKQEQQADKTRSSLANMLDVKRRAWQKLAAKVEATEDPAALVAFAKVAGEGQVSEVKLAELIGDTGDTDKQRQQARTSWLAAIEYSSHLTARAVRRYGDRVLPGIAERVERHMLKRKV